MQYSHHNPPLWGVACHYSHSGPRGMIDIPFHALQPLIPSAERRTAQGCIYVHSERLGYRWTEDQALSFELCYESSCCSSLEVNQSNFSLKLRFEEFRQVGGRVGLISSNVVGNQYIWMKEVSRDHHGDGGCACLGFTKIGTFFPKGLL